MGRVVKFKKLFDFFMADIYNSVKEKPIYSTLKKEVMKR